MTMMHCDGASATHSADEFAAVDTCVVEKRWPVVLFTSVSVYAVASRETSALMLSPG